MSTCQIKMNVNSLNGSRFGFHIFQIQQKQVKIILKAIEMGKGGGCEGGK